MYFVLDLSPILANRADVRPELRPNTDIAEFEYSFGSLNNHRTLCSAAVADLSQRPACACFSKFWLLVNRVMATSCVIACFVSFPRFSYVAENAWNEL